MQHGLLWAGHRFTAVTARPSSASASGAKPHTVTQRPLQCQLPPLHLAASDGPRWQGVRVSIWLLPMVPGGRVCE